MFKCWILRHAKTNWNEMKLIQGQTDLSLSPQGMADAHDWVIPDEARDCIAYTSPLKRAIETAQILDLNPIIDPLLIEMDWGRYEGENIDFLRMEIGSIFIENEKRGLYFQPPLGETPYMVRERLKTFLNTVESQEKDIIIIAHKGIIRALYSLATGWDMSHNPSHKLSDQSIHCFKVHSSDHIEIDQLNIPLLLAMKEDI